MNPCPHATALFLPRRSSATVTIMMMVHAIQSCVFALHTTSYIDYGSYVRQCFQGGMIMVLVVGWPQCCDDLMTTISLCSTSTMTYNCSMDIRQIERRQCV